MACRICAPHNERSAHCGRSRARAASASPPCTHAPLARPRAPAALNRAALHCTLQVHASAEGLKLITFDADGTLYADGAHMEQDNQMIAHIINLMRSNIQVRMQARMCAHTRAALPGPAPATACLGAYRIFARAAVRLCCAQRRWRGGGLPGGASSVPLSEGRPALARAGGYRDCCWLPRRAREV